MRCLQCHKNVLYRERLNKRCPHCQQKFVFETRTGDLLNDWRFARALKEVSDQHSLHWTTEQFWYLLESRYCGRTLRQQSQNTLIGTYFIAGIIGVALMLAGQLSGALLALIMGGLGLPVTGLALWLRRHNSPLIQLSLQQVQDWLKRWEAVHGSVPGKLPPLQLKPASGTQHALSESYNVGQALICDRPETVAFLLANDFHIEQRCALLSVGGYPPEDFEGLRQMLKRNPQLNVFVLHDASYNGCRLYHDLTSDPAWFKGSKRVFDLGLFPRHAGALRGRWNATGNSRQRSPLPGYSEAENIWLQHHEISLMALPPKTLLKQIQRLLSQHAQQASAAYASGEGDGEWHFESDDLLRIGEIGDSDSDFG